MKHSFCCDIIIPLVIIIALLLMGAWLVSPAPTGSLELVNAQEVVAISFLPDRIFRPNNASSDDLHVICYWIKFGCAPLREDYTCAKQMPCVINTPDDYIDHHEIQCTMPSSSLIQQNSCNITIFLMKDVLTGSLPFLPSSLPSERLKGFGSYQFNHYTDLMQQYGSRFTQQIVWEESNWMNNIDILLCTTVQRIGSLFSFFKN